MDFSWPCWHQFVVRRSLVWFPAVEPYVAYTWTDCMLSQPLQIHICVTLVSKRPCALGVITSTLTLTFYLKLKKSLSSEVRTLRETAYLGSLLELLYKGRCPYLFPSTKGRSFSDHDETDLDLWVYQNVVRSHFMPTFIWQKSSAWFYLRSMSYLVSCSCPPEQWWTWCPSHGVVFKPYQILVSYSHKLCATVATANLAC